jgi:predicted RNA-binding protein associated with RNAse of E/G family
LTTTSVSRDITIVYRRLPDDAREFPSVLRKATESKLIIESPIIVDRPIKVSGETIADAGYLAIWFVYKNRWYDVGKFYDQTQRWIGYYCDILKPVKKLFKTNSRTVTLTDLFLDLWISKSGHAFVLDEEELEDAIRTRNISANLAQEARRHIHALMRRVNAGHFPSSEVRAIEPLRKNLESWTGQNLSFASSSVYWSSR